VIRLSQPQLIEMCKAVFPRKAAARKQRGWLRNEKVWTLLLADALSQAETREAALALMCPGRAIPPSCPDVWFEAQPLSSRKGLRGATEGNTKLDLALGSIQRRGKTEAGIEFEPPTPAGNPSDSWVCFVEAKWLSDCSADVSHDPFRNQLTRVIENLICFGNTESDIQPERFYFTLVTPRAFKRDGDRPQKLYGYKMREYMDDRDALLSDIKLSKFPWRRGVDVKGDEFRARLQPDRLTLTWTTFEDVLQGVTGVDWAHGHGLIGEKSSVWDPGPRARAIVRRLFAERAPGRQ